MKSMLYPAALTAATLSFTTAFAQYTATYDPTNLPPTTEQDQHGTNQCGTGNNQTSLCQNVYMNGLNDFCVWGPPEPNSVIGNVEQIVVSYCSLPGRGTRLFTDGTIKSVHFVETPDYIQVTGHGKFTNINIQDGDAGGELDPHGPDGFGNPHGGLVFSNVWSGGQGLGQQIHEWTNFQSFDQFCFRACKPGPRAAEFCQHIYDVLGCVWNIPGDYGDGFTSCKGDNVIPMGLYPQGDSTSTFHQGEPVTPDPHPAAATSSCSTFESAALFAATTTGGTSTSTSTASGATKTTTGTGTTTGGSNTRSTVSQTASETNGSSSALRSVSFAPGAVALFMGALGALIGSLAVIA